MDMKTKRPSLRTMAGLTIDFKTANVKQIYGVRKALSEINHSIEALKEEVRLMRLQEGIHRDFQ